MTEQETQIIGVRKALAMLNVQRQSLEQESAGIVSELTAVNPENPDAPPMGIDTPLVDREGYPRGDVDIYRARSLRGRLAEIRTDHSKVMKEIETRLHQLALLQNTNKSQEEKEENAARTKEKPKPKYDPVSGKWVVRNWDGTISGAGKADSKRSFDDLVAPVVPDAMPAVSEGVANMTTIEETKVHRAAASNSPLARVDSVAPNSPAAAAGMKANDVIAAFGPITGEMAMSDIANLVRSAAAANEVIELRVQRDYESAPLLLQLKPRPWTGRGLLGCHIVPV